MISIPLMVLLLRIASDTLLPAEAEAAVGELLEPSLLIVGRVEVLLALVPHEVEAGLAVVDDDAVGVARLAVGAVLRRVRRPRRAAAAPPEEAEVVPAVLRRVRRRRRRPPRRAFLRRVRARDPAAEEASSVFGDTVVGAAVRRVLITRGAGVGAAPASAPPGTGL